MLKFMRRAKGSVTIFLLVIMMPMLVFSFTVVDLCRIFTAQDVVACAADEAVNSALTSYDKVLKDMYGLMATSADEKELAEKMSEYYVMTLSANGVKLSEDEESQAHQLMDSLFQSNTVINLNELSSAQNLLNIKAEDLDDGILEAILVPESAISNPAVMKRQIVEYMKYRGPVKIAEGMLSKITALSDLPNQTKAVEKKMDFEQKMADIGEDGQTIYTLFRIYLDNLDKLKESHVDPGNLPYLDKIYEGIKGAGDTEAELMNRYCIYYDNNDYNFGISVESYTGDPNPYALNDLRCLYSLSENYNLENAFYVLILLSSYLNEDGSAKTYTAEKSKKSEEDLVEILTEFSDNKNSCAMSKVLDKYKSNKNIYNINAWTNTDFYENIRNICYSLWDGSSSYNAQKSQLTLDIFNAFAPLYSTKRDACEAKISGEWYSGFAEEYEDFVSSYEAAKEIADSADSEEENTDDDGDGSADDNADSEETKEESNAEKLAQLVDDLSGLYDDVNELKENNEEFVGRAISNQSNNIRMQCVSLLHDYHLIYQQYAILNRLTKDDGELSKLVASYIDAINKANEYKGAVDSMEDPSMKSSMDTQRKTETKAFEETNADELQQNVDALIATLNKQKATFKSILDMYNGYQFYGFSLVDKVNIDEEPPKDFSNYDIKDDLKGVFKRLIQGNDIHTKMPTKVLDATNSAYQEHSSHVFCPMIYQSDIPADITNRTLKDWPDYKPAITGNSVYKKIETTALPTRETTKDSTAKDKITDLGKTGDNGMPSTASSGTSSGSSGGSSGGSDDGFDLNKFLTTETVEASSVTSFENYYSKTEGGISANEQSVSVSTGDDDDSSTDSAKNALSTMGDFMKDLLTATRDNLYITEYLTESFSCHTTNMKDGKLEEEDSKKEKNLMNELFCEDTNAYRGELEYILYGFDSNAKNVAAASGIIFALRFVLNLIYSFTDGEINGITNSIAATAAGLFPFAIPIVKTVLHIGLAIAESGYDIAELLKGNEVPLFKDTTTWICKPSNLGKAIIGEVVTTVANYAIDAAADGVSQLIDEAAAKGEEFTAEGNEKVNEYIDEQKNKIKESLKNTIQTPFEMKLQELMLSVPESYNVSDTKASFSSALISLRQDLFSSLGISESSHSANLLQEAEWAVLSQLDDAKITSMAGTAVDNLEEYISQSTGVSIDTSSQEAWESTANNLSTLVSGKIFKPLNDIIDKIADKGTDLSKKIENKVNEAIGDLAKQAKEGTVKGADKLKQGLQNKMDEFVGSPAKTSTSGSKVNLSKDENSSISLDESKGKNSIGSLIKMSYKDYLYIFTLIGLCANDSNMLQRAAQIMTVNCQKKLGDDDYSLNEAVTFIGAKTKGSVKTVFYGAVFSDGKLDFSGKPDRYSFTRTAYMGY